MKNGRKNASVSPKRKPVQSDSPKRNPVQSDSPTRKRSRVAQTSSPRSAQLDRIPREFVKVRGKFASLQGMMTSLPLEIILLIFIRLDPRDLLSLSRTSKNLREILMDKSSETIWRTVWINYEDSLPPLPVDLNEPQFARLIFDAYCHLQMRPELFVISDVFPTERITVGDHVRTVYDHRVVSKMSKQYLALSSEEDRQAWVVQKQQDIQAIEQHARHCEAWHTAKLEQHARELQDIRDQRLQAILTRLEATGLSGEVQRILSGSSKFEEASVLIKLCSLNQAKRLTNHSWNSIESDLVKMLSIHRSKRLQEEHLEVCRKRSSQLKVVYLDILSQEDLRNPFPGVGDILTDPILEAMIWDTAKEEELTPEFLRSRIIDELPRILCAWRTTQTEKLLEVLRVTRHDATLLDLHLATTIFGCSRSDERMRAVNKLYDTAAQEGPWSPRSLFIHHPSSRLVERIMAGASLDPSTTTICDLTAAYPLIECTGHPATFFPGRLFVSWPAALTHNLVIQDEMFFNINRFGEESITIRAQEPLNIFAVIHCAHCHKEMTFYDLLRHLPSVHDVHAVSTTSTVTDIHRHFETHWYWNPHDNLNVIGMDFRYDPITL
ncbi:hypothetical protein C8R42DRAFT_720632 [Lentinula raphanica]|nr:hypothetical protein C8R42DRAFT_720632 [Lentinula raphanica]